MRTHHEKPLIDGNVRMGLTSGVHPGQSKKVQLFCGSGTTNVPSGHSCLVGGNENVELKIS